MGDKNEPRFAAKTRKHRNTGELPDAEYSAATYGSAADVVAECRKHIERVQNALREGKI
ncbi:hypothetical protein GCM10009613_65600 [Pseudonocardia kongjuensis]|uniref:DUF3606 domain-containing protein n=1 Tax=Pseudonocardia kongjuensis TaxID=102227 RepID=A0ABN1YCB5_9PSEU